MEITKHTDGSRTIHFSLMEASLLEDIANVVEDLDLKDEAQDYHGLLTPEHAQFARRVFWDI
jgi:hypothetical protein